MKTQAVMEIRK